MKGRIRVAVTSCLLVTAACSSSAKPSIQQLRGGVSQPWEKGLGQRDKDLEAPLPLSGLQKDAKEGLDQGSDDSVSVVYLKIFGVVLLWVGTGTVFYSRWNEWPLPQSFFYAVDAGMSIGFCTDVREKLVSSRAFTILFILLGASVVGGALALFVEDAMEGVLSASTRGYQRLLEQQAFLRADVDRDGSLSYNEFRAVVAWFGYTPSETEFARLCRRFDRDRSGEISYREFKQSYEGLERLLQQQKRRAEAATEERSSPFGSMFFEDLSRELVAFGSWAHRRRIYLSFFAWMAMGVTWGCLKQGWDVITAMHFATSALATGGLTAPPVNAEGIMPADDAIFVGAYCLFGIPLFALTLSKFARVLVESHMVASERRAIETPMHREEFELAKSLCTDDGVVHLSDFIVLHLLRQGKLTIDNIRLLRAQFNLLDADSSGVLTVEEATGAARTKEGESQRPLARLRDAAQREARRQELRQARGLGREGLGPDSDADFFRRMLSDATDWHP